MFKTSPGLPSCVLQSTVIISNFQKTVINECLCGLETKPEKCMYMYFILLCTTEYLTSLLC